MRAIVTGATGFIGKYLVQELLDNGYDVVAVVRDASGISGNLLVRDNLTIIQSTLEELEVQDFPKYHFDVFFHLAWGGVNREEIDNDSVHEESYNASVRCLQIALKLGCKTFCDSGTRAEYGRINKMCEDCECWPEGAYGTWKMRFYKQAYSVCKENDLKYIHYRIFSVIGVGDHKWSLVSTSCRNLINNQDMAFGLCQHLWNYMAVEDAVRAIRISYEKRDRLGSGDNSILNIASYDTRVLRSFIEEIYQITSSESKLHFESNDASSYDIRPNIEKISKLTGWKCQISFHEQIKKIIYELKKEN